mmetsp:Transcript_22711/g.36462  ORF Transcript_22711/g.36462 Transcript_22711/m.36462 type:complete len:215 (+) Transcript_22711:22-666(+)
MRGRRKFIGGDSDTDNDNECGGYVTSLLNPSASMTPMNDEDEEDDEDEYIVAVQQRNKKFKAREPVFKKQKLCTQQQQPGLTAATVNDKFVEQMMQVNEHDLSVDPLLSSMDYASPTATTRTATSDTETVPLPSYLLLSKPENDFISHCKLLPSQYMQYKDVIIMNNMLHGCVNLDELGALLPHLNVERIAEFCDFFQRMGWIRISGEAKVFTS